MNDFSNFIDEANNAIQLGQKYLSSGKLSEDKVNNLRFSILYSALRKTIALYSSGADQVQVTSGLLETITAFEEGFRWAGFEKSYAMYDQIIWIVSLGILCNISNEDFKRVTTILKRDNAADRLIATLVNYKLPGTISRYGTTYIQKHPYAELDTVVSGNNPGAAAIKEYLDKKWYQGHSDAPWHDAHKNTKVNVFFGYWAWETAALVKIYSIDDSILKEQQYYPYRAVHWEDTSMV